MRTWLGAPPGPTRRVVGRLPRTENDRAGGGASSLWVEWGQPSALAGEHFPYGELGDLEFTLLGDAQEGGAPNLLHLRQAGGSQFADHAIGEVLARDPLRAPRHGHQVEECAPLEPHRRNVAAVAMRHWQYSSSSCE